MDLRAYSNRAIPHLASLIDLNASAMETVAQDLLASVRGGGSLFVFGSGHSSIFAFELYHRAGGASFVIPIIADFLLPHAGPPLVRRLERAPGLVTPVLHRARPRAGDMIWISSQSGINSSGIDVALEAKTLGMRTVAFTSRKHSAAVTSRHPSGKRLMEVCDSVIDLGGETGDAAVEVVPGGVRAGALSSLGAILLGHSIVVAVCGELEAEGRRCVYTSVNTPEGEKRNLALEAEAAKRDALLLG